MPITMTYFYSVVYGTSKQKQVEPCECSVSVYDFSAVNGCALCYLASGTELKYASPKLVDDPFFGKKPTGETELKSRTVGENGEWITIQASNLKLSASN